MYQDNSVFRNNHFIGAAAIEVNTWKQSLSITAAEQPFVQIKGFSIAHLVARSDTFITNSDPLCLCDAKILRTDFGGDGIEILNLVPSNEFSVVLALLHRGTIFIHHFFKTDSRWPLRSVSDLRSLSSPGRGSAA